MSPRPTQPLRDEHDGLRSHVRELSVVARDLPNLFPDERAASLRRAVEFLTEVLLPHARGEEIVLYPAWSRLVGHPHAAAPMIAEHRAIAALTDRLAATSAEDVPGAQEQLYGLRALIELHFGVEEGIVLPAFDGQSQGVVDALLARVAEAAGHQHAH